MTSTSHGDWKDLLHGARQGDAAVVRYHLAAGVDPTFQHPEYFTNPLLEAVRAGHADIVGILLDHTPSLLHETEDLTDLTPLEVAMQEKRHDMVDLLLERCTPKQAAQACPTILITGGNRGIGKAIARVLLEAGRHRVWITCRSRHGGHEVVQELQSATGNAKIECLVGDLGTVASVRKLIETIQTKVGDDKRHLSAMILNAGWWPTSREITEDGLELTFMVNYLAPYMMCRSLLPMLLQQQNGNCRIVLVNAGLYLWGQPQLDLTPYGHDFSRLRTYAHTKHCSVMFMLDLARELEGTSVTINAVHPGVIRTDLGESSSSCCQRTVIHWLKYFTSKDVAYGAVVPCWLATSSDVEGVNGAYCLDNKKVHECVDSVKDVTVQKEWRLWTEDFLARHQSS